MVRFCFLHYHSFADSLAGPELQKKVNTIVRRLLQEYAGTGRVLSLNRMWGCFSSDSIMGFAFEPDRQYNFIESDGFHSLFPEAVAGLLEPLHWMLNMPTVSKLLMGLPDWVLKAMDAKMGSVVDFRQVSTNWLLIRANV